MLQNRTEYNAIHYNKKSYNSSWIQQGPIYEKKTSYVALFGSERVIMIIIVIVYYLTKTIKTITKKTKQAKAKTNKKHNKPQQQS